MEIEFDADIELESMNSIENLNKLHCFIIGQEYSKITISVCKEFNHIHEYFKNKKISHNRICAFIDYKKIVNDYEIIIRIYNICGKENNKVQYNLLKLKRMIIFNTNLLNFKNILKEMIYIQLNSILKIRKLII